MNGGNVSKTVVALVVTVGSNPTLSARFARYRVRGSRPSPLALLATGCVDRDPLRSLYSLQGAWIATLTERKKRSPLLSLCLRGNKIACFNLKRPVQ